MCGGTPEYLLDHRPGTGLSPRVRGNLGDPVTDADETRSIPACAGEPGAIDHCHGYTRVYPRVCGGTRLCSTQTMVPAGLSPRVRGNHHAPERAAWRRRSIPACAGEPLHGLACIRRSKVYPRVCGGTQSMDTSSPCFGGLSPRVRGNPQWPGAW